MIDFQSPRVYLCQRCGYDLRYAPASPTHPESFEIQQTIDDLLHGNIRTEDLFSRWQLPALPAFFVFLRDLVTLAAILSRKYEQFAQWQSVLFGKPLYQKLSSSPGFSFDMRSAEERRIVLHMAAHLLKEDAAYLTDSLVAVRATQSIRDRHFPRSPVMEEILFHLPASNTFRKSKPSAGRAVCKEPLDAEAVETKMNAIRRLL